MAIERINTSNAMSTMTTGGSGYRTQSHAASAEGTESAESTYAQEYRAENISVGTGNSQNRGFSGAEEEKQGNAELQGNVDKEKVKSAVADINKQIKMRHTQCSFQYHEDTNRISIKVMDSDTKEVIREIPPEKALDMLAKAWELAGLMVDEKR